MADIDSTTVYYTLRVSDTEFNLLTKALALLAGLAGPRATPDDRENARRLNDLLLKTQAADLREKLAASEHKQQKS